jgi:hypothetical protein
MLSETTWYSGWLSSNNTIPLRRPPLELVKYPRVYYCLRDCWPETHDTWSSTAVLVPGTPMSDICSGSKFPKIRGYRVSSLAWVVPPGCNTRGRLQFLPADFVAN